MECSQRTFPGNWNVERWVKSQTMGEESNDGFRGHTFLELRIPPYRRLAETPRGMRNNFTVTPLAFRTESMVGRLIRLTCVCLEDSHG